MEKFRFERIYSVLEALDLMRMGNRVLCTDRQELTVHILNEKRLDYVMQLLENAETDKIDRYELFYRKAVKQQDEQ